MGRTEFGDPVAWSVGRPVRTGWGMPATRSSNRDCSVDIACRAAANDRRWPVRSAPRIPGISGSATSTDGGPHTSKQTIAITAAGVRDQRLEQRRQIGSEIRSQAVRPRNSTRCGVVVQFRGPAGSSAVTGSARHRRPGDRRRGAALAESGPEPRCPARETDSAPTGSAVRRPSAARYASPVR